MRMPAKALVCCTISCKLIIPDLKDCSIANRWTASMRSSEAGASHACLQAAWQADMFYIVVKILLLLNRQVWSFEDATPDGYEQAC